MVAVRDAGSEDGTFLAEVLVLAVDWRPDLSAWTVEECLQVAQIAHYVTDWPRSGDCGVIAEDGDRVGAAWFRFLSLHDRGYGYVADDVPELTIGVLPRWRGRGIGEALLRRLLDRARESSVRALSLSVEDDNPAIRLYERVGFVRVGHAADATTMVAQIDR